MIQGQDLVECSTRLSPSSQRFSPNRMLLSQVQIWLGHSWCRRSWMSLRTPALTTEKFRGSVNGELATVQRRGGYLLRNWRNVRTIRLVPRCSLRQSAIHYVEYAHYVKRIACEPAKRSNVRAARKLLAYNVGWAMENISYVPSVCKGGHKVRWCEAGDTDLSVHTTVTYGCEGSSVWLLATYQGRRTHKNNQRD